MWHMSWQLQMCQTTAVETGVQTCRQIPLSTPQTCRQIPVSTRQTGRQIPVSTRQTCRQRPVSTPQTCRQIPVSTRQPKLVLTTRGERPSAENSFEKDCVSCIRGRSSAITHRIRTLDRLTPRDLRVDIDVPRPRVHSSITP